MSSDKVNEAKASVTDTAEKTKQFGEEKAGEAQTQFDDANKEAEKQLDAANKSDDPSFADQAKAKADQAKSSAASAHEKLTDTAGSTWTKTKETISNLNQYPDKK